MRKHRPTLKISPHINCKNADSIDRNQNKPSSEVVNLQARVNKGIFWFCHAVWQLDDFQILVEIFFVVAFRYGVGSSRVDLQACKLEYSIVSPK